MKKKRSKPDPDLAQALAAALARNTLQSRLEAMEIMRRIQFGKAAIGRMKKVIEVVHPDGTIQRLRGNRRRRSR